MLRSNTEIIFDDAAEVCKAVDLRPLDGATVLITGATGLLGTHFLASLCLARENGIKSSVFAQCHSKPAEYTEELAKRGDTALIKALPSGADVIIHASGYAQPSVFTLNPAETIRINTALTQELLDRLSIGGKFLFVSSSEVCSGLKKAWAKESDIGTTNPYHPRACYIEGKRCGEAITDAYRKAGVHAISARLSLAYGPGTRKHDKRVMSTFIEKALTLGKIEMKYAGEESRTYCYIRDAVRMLWQAALYGTQPVYNVGGKQLVRTKDMVECIGKITGTKVTSPVASEMVGAPETLCLDTTRIETEFGKNDYVGLEEGLRRTIDWQRGLYASVQG
jgi:UDP-glucuronate decarboxylase